MNGAIYCHKCGKKQVAQKGTGKRKRGNGQGSVYKPSGGKSWVAVKVLGYEPLENGKLKPVVDKKQGFATKTEALEYLPNLGRGAKKIDTSITFKGIYDLWLPEFQKRGRSKSTEDNYKAAMKHYKDIWFIKFSDIGIDDLQECIDDCPKGKRTRQVMKVLGGLLYGYAIPRGYVDNVNKAQYIFVSGAEGTAREEFKEHEIEKVRQSIGKVPYADYIYCNIYLGFRPHEFITLDVSQYNAEGKYFVAGEKTEAGKDRIVTVSPKIQAIIDQQVKGKTSGSVFPNENGEVFGLRAYREDVFYVALEAMGLPTPRTAMEGGRKLTPHCCRHTFATLMKNVQAADIDKLSLIGHTSVEMLQHYQHTNLEDLRKITDQI